MRIMRAQNKVSVLARLLGHGVLVQENQVHPMSPFVPFPAPQSPQLACGRNTSWEVSYAFEMTVVNEAFGRLTGRQVLDELSFVLANDVGVSSISSSLYVHEKIHLGGSEWNSCGHAATQQLPILHSKSIPSHRMSPTQVCSPSPSFSPIDPPTACVFSENCLARKKLMEEFEEADILWPDYDRDEDELTEEWHAGLGARRRTSSPVEIPSRPQPVRSWTLGFASSDRVHGDDDDKDDGGKTHIVPPHVMVTRRIAGKTSFSVCVGNGRTLKGRDLRQVRNSILRMTGFLER